MYPRRHRKRRGTRRPGKTGTRNHTLAPGKRRFGCRLPHRARRQALRRAPYRHDSVETRPSRPSAGRVFRRGDRRVHPSAAILLAERRQRRQRLRRTERDRLHAAAHRRARHDAQHRTRHVGDRPTLSRAVHRVRSRPAAHRRRPLRSSRTADRALRGVRPRPRPARRRNGRRVESNLNLVRGRTRRAYRDAQPRCQALSA